MKRERERTCVSWTKIAYHWKKGRLTLNSHDQVNLNNLFWIHEIFQGPNSETIVVLHYYVWIKRLEVINPMTPIKSGLLFVSEMTALMLIQHLNKKTEWEHISTFIIKRFPSLKRLILIVPILSRFCCANPTP